MFDSDTIAAIATPIGMGGVAIIRISGPKSIEILNNVVIHANSIKPRYLYNGIINNIDNVLFAYMKSPASYTGEDVVEINCHGGVAVAKRVLDKCLEAGARLANGGEFTKRAFLNQKLDLSQAEAVLELIEAKTEKGVEEGAKKAVGSLKNKINEIKEELIDVLAKIEASIDFSDDIDLNPNSLSTEIAKSKEEIERLLESSRYGEIIRCGIGMAIIGRPNVGKSSLLNALLKRDRAIVSEMPGTTRDTIEEWLNIKGIPVKVVDTAGLRNAGSKIEQMGISKAFAEINKAEILLVVYDASEKVRVDDEYVTKYPKKITINVMNKIDIGDGSLGPGVKISAKTGEGIEKLEGEIYKRIIGSVGRIEEGEAIVSERQRDCLRRANECLQRAMESFKMGSENELIAIDLKESIMALGEISGELVSGEVIESIFNKFCVGK